MSKGLPSAPFRQVAQRYLDDNPYVPASTLLEPVFSHEAEIRQFMAGKYEEIEFNTADRLLCRLNLVHLWTTDPEFMYMYWRLPLKGLGRVQPPPGHARCKRVGCSNLFKQHTYGSPKKYCSVICKNQEYKRRHGMIKTEQLGPNRKLSLMRCRNGHIRTHENTKIVRGKRRCLECHAATNIRYYERKKDADRRYYERNKELVAA